MEQNKEKNTPPAPKKGNENNNARDKAVIKNDDTRPDVLRDRPDEDFEDAERWGDITEDEDKNKNSK